MADTKTKIIEAARTLFSRFGYRRTTVTEIAKAAYVVKGAFYHYFDSKEELLRFIVEEELEQSWLATENKLNGISSPKEKMAVYLQVSIQKLRKRSNAFAALTNEFEAAPAIEKIKQSISESRKEYIADILRAGIESGDFRSLDVDSIAWAIILTQYSVMLSSTTVRATNSDAEHYLATFADLICNGLKS